MENNGEVGKHLSQNDTLYVYSESPGEYFTNIVRDFHDDAIDAPENEFDHIRQRYFKIVAVQNRHISDIFAEPYVARMYNLLWKFNADYYVHTKLFQPYAVKKAIFGSHAAVSILLFHFACRSFSMQLVANTVICGIKTIQSIASNNYFPSFKDTEAFLRKYQKSKTPDEAQKRTAKEYDKLLCKAEEDLINHQFWTKEILQRINDVAKSMFGNMKNSIGTINDEYVSECMKYGREITLIIDEVHPNSPVADRAKARLLWIYYHRPGIPTPLPIMTEAVYELWDEAFDVVSDALTEV